MILRLIVSRLAQAVVTLLAVSTFIFMLGSVIPGDIAARVLGRESTLAERTAFRHEIGLDRPVLERYGVWLKNVAQGDFGTSYVSHEPVSNVISAKLTNTLWLAVFAFVLYIPVTLIGAIIGAAFHDRFLDRATSVLTLIGLALPEFVLGTLLVLVFAITWPVFPALSYFDAGASFFSKLHSLVLPAVTLTVAASVYAIRMLRDSLIEVLESDYIRQAKLKGVPRRRILFRHALPNALGPALNVTALNTTYLIAGVVVVELLFAYDGLGKLMLDRLTLRDMPVIEAAALIGSALYVGANLVADLLAYVFNPKLRTA